MVLLSDYFMLREMNLYRALLFFINLFCYIADVSIEASISDRVLAILSVRVVSNALFS